jgi:hypothetical protein
MASRMQLATQSDTRKTTAAHDAVIRVCDSAGNVIETQEHKGRVQRVVIGSSISFPMFERIWFSHHTGSNRKYSWKMR